MEIGSATIGTLDCVQLIQCLLSNGFSADIAENFAINGIDGETFFEMSEEHMKEVAPRIADRIKLMKFVSANKPTKVCKKNLVILH